MEEGLAAKRSRRWSLLILIGLFACKPGGAKSVAASAEPALPASASATGAASASASAAPAPVAPATGSPEAGASDPRSEGQPDCRFERPEDFSEGRVSWLGGCHKGFAHGSGVILYESEGVESRRFYGRVEEGHPSLGVLESYGGYKAGAWARGAPAAPLDDGLAQRNVVIHAFDAAAAAATAVSQAFAKKHDAKSSSFYATQAKKLHDAMD